MDETVDFEIRLDPRGFEETLSDLASLSDDFGRQLARALGDAAIRGRALDDVLRRVGLSLASLALQQALAPLQNLAGGLLGGALGMLKSILPFADGGVPGRPVPFADGGVVATPTYFPLGRQLGLMGEAGAEAILPLARGADGRLGVAASGGAPAVNVVFNVTSPDAASFRKSQAQITGMIARAAARGARTM